MDDAKHRKELEKLLDSIDEQTIDAERHLSHVDGFLTKTSLSSEERFRCDRALFELTNAAVNTGSAIDHSNPLVPSHPANAHLHDRLKDLENRLDAQKTIFGIRCVPFSYLKSAKPSDKLLQRLDAYDSGLGYIESVHKTNERENVDDALIMLRRIGRSLKIGRCKSAFGHMFNPGGLSSFMTYYGQLLASRQSIPRASRDTRYDAIDGELWPVDDFREVCGLTVGSDSADSSSEPFAPVNVMFDEDEVV